MNPTMFQGQQQGQMGMGQQPQPQNPFLARALQQQPLMQGDPRQRMPGIPQGDSEENGMQTLPVQQPNGGQQPQLTPLSLQPRPLSLGQK